MTIVNKALLTEQYEKGIIKTWFKSTMLTKINDLRDCLGLPGRAAALPEKHYDKQAFDKLKSIDFSPLDTYVPCAHNAIKFLVLSCSGVGFTAVGAEGLEDNAPLLGGLDEEHAHSS